MVLVITAVSTETTGVGVDDGGIDCLGEDPVLECGDLAICPNSDIDFCIIC